MIKESFDESNMELPNWFLLEQGPKKQKGQRSSSGNQVNNGRAPGGKKKDITRRPPRLGPLRTPTSGAASGLKTPRSGTKAAKIATDNAADAELKSWLEDHLGEFKSR